MPEVVFCKPGGLQRMKGKSLKIVIHLFIYLLFCLLGLSQFFIMFTFINLIIFNLVRNQYIIFFSFICFSFLFHNVLFFINTF